MAISKPRTLLRSLLLSYVISGILLLILAFALYKLKLTEPQINMSVYIIYIIASLFGGFLTGKSTGTRRFFWGLITGLLYFLILFLVSWLMKDGASLDMTRAMTVMGTCILGGTVGGMMS